MVEEEAGVDVYLHSWGCRALVEEGAVKGVAFESKEGRQAVLGKMVIDCTGDGDIFASAGERNLIWIPTSQSEMV